VEQNDIVNHQFRGIDLDRNTLAQYAGPPREKLTQLFAGSFRPVFLVKAKNPFRTMTTNMANPSCGIPARMARPPATQRMRAKKCTI